MTLKSEIQSLLKRLNLQSVPSNVLAVESLVDRISPTVPFSFSALGQYDAGGAVNGISFMLPMEGEVDYTLIGDTLTGLVIYLDIQRGTYWGDIVISVDADPIYNVGIALETLDATQCNSLVSFSFTGTAETDTAYAATITATGGDFSISRTFTINTITEA